MALYDVVKPCMVGKLHYARPTTQPVEVDDATAAPLVKAGNLSRCEPESAAPVQEPVEQPATSTPQRRGGRRAED